jgi:spermidine synthase
LNTPQAYKWFFEPTTAVEGHMHAIKRTIVEAQTKFQHAEIMETPAYGKLLVLDGRIQSSQAEDFIYHEALVHPGMLASEHRPESGMVIGGGEGATLREVLRYPSVKRAVMVDIDGEVVELCKQYLPEMHQGAFEDKRSEVRSTSSRSTWWSRWRKARPASCSPRSSTRSFATGSRPAAPSRSRPG